MSDKKRIHGITWLKAFLPFLVIACHARPFGDSSAMSIEFSGIPDWKDVLYVNILTIAVPVFFLISFYLYQHKRSKDQNSNWLLLKKRIVYLGGGFLIVRAIYILFNIGDLWIADRGFPRNLYHLLFGGGDTLLYYLEHLVYYLILLEILLAVCDKWNWDKVKVSTGCFIFSIIILLLLQYVSPEVLRIEAMRYFSPFGFLPLLFAGVILFENSKTEFKLPHIIALIVVGVITAIIEWLLLPETIYLENGYSMAIPYYARLSCIVLSIALFMAALKIRKQPGQFVTILSGLSLYVYCIHQIIIKVTNNLLGSSYLKYLIVTIVTYLISVIILKCKVCATNYRRKL